MANFLIIRDLCDRKKITIRELATKVGMQDISIHQLIKKGKTNTETLEKIAEILDVSVGIFFDDVTGGNITQKGKRNTASIYGNISLSDCQKEVEHLQELLKEKEQLLEEKERTIQILMGDKNK
jgi:transcriptional regulator with XRE-family HTH domain